MASQPSRPRPETSISDLERDDRRGWLSHGVAALAISALGLVVAASVSVTTGAETTTVGPPRSTLSRGVEQSRIPALPGQPPAAAGTDAAAESPELVAFSRRAAEIDEESRDSVRAAIVEERAAQRSEDLTRSAEGIAREAVQRGNSARRQELAAADRARRVAAVKAAQERTLRAVRARVTAEVKRELARKAREEAARRAAAAANSNSGSDSGSNSGPEEPADQPSQNRPESEPNTADIPSGGGSRSPVPGAVVGASFGATGAWARYHTGLDFRAGFGTPIRAVTSGVVVYAGNKGNWAGNHVAVRHAGGYTSMSSHMQSMAVSAGSSVSAGQVIGYVGSTGRSFGAHLHFEVYPPGVQPGDVYSAINPIPWLRARGVHTN